MALLQQDLIRALSFDSCKAGRPYSTGETWQIAQIGAGPDKHSCHAFMASPGLIRYQPTLVMSGSCTSVAVNGNLTRLLHLQSEDRHVLDRSC